MTVRDFSFLMAPRGFRKALLFDSRVPALLLSVIADAVKKADCEDFVGVIVARLSVRVAQG
jgi:hypothetical protein